MAIVDNPKTLDLDDVQGMIIRGYGKLYQTAYFLLKVKDATEAKKWLKDTHPKVDSADLNTHPEQTLHLAFTSVGLAALGMEKDNIMAFPIPFREGMVTDDRSRILGDYAENAPNKWRWGGDQKNDLHIMLIFHAKTDADLDAFMATERATIEEGSALEITTEMKGHLPIDGKEPFGFHDGISQPVVKGSGREGPENDFVETGEFLLGYKNEHGQYPFSPLLENNQGNISLLADDAEGSEKKDLGKNGSFMVYRQIEQHVDKFWAYMAEKTKNEDGTFNDDAKTKLASKCIGRWPSGASLALFPDKDPGGNPSNDDFGYAEHDPDGLKCPFGSHLRRNNPRDSFRWYNPKQSLKISRRHRIIRRGRNYQLPPKNGEEKGEIGLHFICFNTNIQLQFEFIQHAWCNNNQLRGLSNDIDIIIGVPPEGDPHSENGQFTIQNEPTNQFVDSWERFVTIKGGEYFFFPSMSVLNYLSTI